MSELEFFFPALVAALKAKWEADVTLTAADVVVFDGPPTNEASAGQPELFVGASGEDYGDGEDAGSTDQTWANANTTERDSSEQVVCGLWLERDDPMATIRTTVAALLKAIAAGLRADLDLGVPGVFHVEMSSIRWRQIQGVNGPRFGAVFVVSAQSRVYL